MKRERVLVAFGFFIGMLWQAVMDLTGCGHQPTGLGKCVAPCVTCDGVDPKSCFSFSPSAVPDSEGQ